MNAGRVRAQAAFELRLLLRNGENLLVSFGIPVALLVFFSLVEVLPAPGRPVDFLLPGMLAVATMGSALVSLSIATAFERSYLVLKRLGTTPLRRSELVAAKSAATMVVLAVQVVALVAVALLLGWRLPAGRAGGALVAAASLLLGAVAFAGLGLALAGRLRALTNLAVVNGLFVVLLLVSGVLFPLDVLPPALAAVAGLLPSAALAETLRLGLSGNGPGAALLVLAGWSVVLPAVAAGTFRWE